MVREVIAIAQHLLLALQHLRLLGLVIGLDRLEGNGRQGSVAGAGRQGICVGWKSGESHARQQPGTDHPSHARLLVLVIR
jgi:hypothetical protein